MYNILNEIEFRPDPTTELSARYRLKTECPQNTDNGGSGVTNFPRFYPILLLLVSNENLH